MTGNNLPEGPKPETVEVTLFGPGYGECCVIHAAASSWVIIDSCIDSDSGMPAALVYLNSIGVDVSTEVKLIIVTHFHDDHVRGISKLAEACHSAEVCISTALSKKEFLSYVQRFEMQELASGSGVSELASLLQHAQRTGKAPIHGIANRRVLARSEGDETAPPVDVWTLSPSDYEVERFLNRIGGLIPQVGETKYRASSSNLNDFSVVCLIIVGDLYLLFGGDLEQMDDPRRGWNAIISSTSRPRGRSALYKVSHHGAASGHSEKVWSEMLVEEPYAILSPWTRGGHYLPTERDVQRICEKTSRAFISARARQPKSKVKRSKVVERTIREEGVKLRLAEAPTGFISLRNHRSQSGDEEWEIALGNGAMKLS